ncbi:hypothetical protein [Nocardia gipuzkoensis]
MPGVEDTPDLLFRLSHTRFAVSHQWENPGMTQCQVQRCPNVATADHTLRGGTDEVRVCDAHDVELAAPDTEWILDRSEDVVTHQTRPALLVGDSLRGLNEYVVQDVSELRRPYDSMSRVFSDPLNNGGHITFEVRRRGEADSAPITLVLNKALAADLVAAMKTIGMV